MEALLAAILDAVFASLAESIGLSDWLRDRLRRDPEKLAFRLALTQALTDAGAHFPGRDVRYFAEILRDIGGPLLARTLQPASPFPTATELTQLWLNHLTIDSAIHYRKDFTAFATLLLDRLNQHIENQQPLQWIVQARRQRSSEEATRRLAEAAVQSASTLATLRQELTQLTAALETALKTGGSTVTTAGGAYVAGSVSAYHFVGRDLAIKNYFVAGLARLPTDYSMRIENFLFTYLGGADERVPFGGRQQQVDELNHWVDDQTAPPYYLMVAEAGKGKSALVCRWSAQLATRADLDVIFVPISIRFQTAAQDVFFGALAARLAQLHEKQAPDLFYKPHTAEEWKAVCESYLRRPLPDGKRLVVIVDGLDEATDWLAGPELFAVRPPTGLRVLVTARLRAKESDALGWAATLNWEGPRLVRKVTLPALDRQGVEEALASMGNPLDGLATQIDIVGKLYYLSEGDPLLVRLYVDELDKKKAQAAFLTPADLDTIQPGLAGFMQKWWEDQRKQWRMQKKDPHAEEERLLPLLSACAVAYGPLLLKDLAALDATHFGATRAVVNRAELLARWLIGDGEHQGYVFAHPRLREFFSGPTWLSDEEYAAWQARFCDWGERVLAALNAEKLEPRQAPEYLLRNYATHLAQSAAPPERFYALISDGWRNAWEQLDVSYGGFLNDVDRTWEKAKQHYDPVKAGKALALVQQIKAALCQASVAALGSKMQPELLAQAVQSGLRTPVQALAIAKLAPTDHKCAEMFSALAPYLPVALLDEALNAARTIRYTPHRADVLSSLAPHLPADQRQAVFSEALNAARTIRYTPHRADVLSSLAPHLPADQRQAVFSEALNAARSIRDEEYRARALRSLAAHLPPDQRQAVLNEAINVACSIHHAEPRARVLNSLAAHLPPALLGEALNAARTIRDGYSRADVLRSLAPHLPPALLGEALNTARTIREEYYRADVLSSLAPHLPPALLNEALNTARAIQYTPDRADVLSSLAPYLPADQCQTVLGEALSAVRTMRGEEYRARRLSNLAPHLPTDQRQTVLGEALNAARTIREEEQRARALSSLAAYLPPDQRQTVLGEALNAARTIRDESSRARALSHLAPHLPAGQRQTVLGEALNASRTIRDESSRVWALSSLAAHLPADQRQIVLCEALNAARVIQHVEQRTHALSGLVAHLPAGQRQTVLSEALNAARSMEYMNFYSIVLRSLTPHMTTDQHQIILYKALNKANSMVDVAERAWALSSLAPHLTTDQRQTVLGKALNAIRSIIQDNNYYVWALSGLAPHLPPALLGEALNTIRTIRDESSRATALRHLAPHLPPALLGEALNAARAIQDESSRARALSHLAPHLPADQRQIVLGEVLNAARVIRGMEDRVWALSSLAPYLPADQRQTVLGEAFNAARVIQHESSLAEALSSLAPHLPAALLSEALNTARAILDGQYRADVLSSLAPRLLADQRQTVLGEALNAASVVSHASVLHSLAQPLADWSHVAAKPAYRAWVESLPMLASRPRDGFLINLTALMPFILALAGDEAPQAAEGIFHAIQEVCAWWP